MLKCLQSFFSLGKHSSRCPSQTGPQGPVGHISVAEDFSKFPAGRYRKHGPYTGEVFREEHLVPALERHAHVNIDLGGVLGYAASFLEEAFGGLVCKHGYDADTLLERITLIGGMPSDHILIATFIAEGENRQRAQKAWDA